MVDKEVARFLDDLRAQRDYYDQLYNQLVAECEAPGGLKRAGQSAVLEYRCAARRCLLLIIWRKPDGLMFYQPSYKLAHEHNQAQSNDAGRANNTHDGDRHWKPQASLFDDRYRPIPGQPIGLHLHCGHVARLVDTGELFDRMSDTPGQPYRHFL